MPYLGKWMEAVAAVTRVMRVDRCDRAAAIRQIEAAIADRALRWSRPRDATAEWRRNDGALEKDDLVYRADLLKLWPEPSLPRAPSGGNGRTWPTLAAAAADLIDWRRWNLLAEQFRSLVCNREAGRSHPLTAALHPPGMVRLRSNGRVCGWNGHAFEPDADGLVTVPAEAAAELVAHGFQIWGFADQAERELRELIAARQIKIEGVGPNGLSIILTADGSQAAVLRFDSNEIWLDGSSPRLWLTVTKIIERSPAAVAYVREKAPMQPPLIFIEPREAVERVREAFGCSGDEAVRFLSDRWIAAEITPRFTGGAPPGGSDPSLADWFAGAVILPEKWPPRQAVNEPGDDPECQRVPGQRFPFKIDRRQLDRILSASQSRTTAEALSKPSQLAPAVNASPPVQAMRSAYARLVRDGEITTADSIKARYRKVRDAAEVTEYIAKVGKQRGLSERTFGRDVDQTEWPGKPQVLPPQSAKS